MPWKSYNTTNISENFLFKFLPVSRLESFLTNGEIWFSRADQFGDKMECVRIADIAQKKLDYSKIEERKKTFLISCWHLANKESLAFWDTYSDDPSNRKNIALRFQRETLIRSFNEHFHRNNKFYFKTKWVHGKVQYRNMINENSNSLNKSKIKYPAFRKEKAFSYENEYRFTIEKINEHLDKGFGYYIGESTRLSFDILINPLLKKEDFFTLKNKVIELGFGTNIKDSILTKWLRPDLW